MFYGKARYLTTFLGKKVFFTRKDKRSLIWKFSRSRSIGKKNKKSYHRQMRNGKYKLTPLKGSQWKKLHCCNLWNWI